MSKIIAVIRQILTSANQRRIKGSIYSASENRHFEVSERTACLAINNTTHLAPHQKDLNMESLDALTVSYFPRSLDALPLVTTTASQLSQIISAATSSTAELTPPPSLPSNGRPSLTLLIQGKVRLEPRAARHEPVERRGRDPAAVLDPGCNTRFRLAYSRDLGGCVTMRVTQGPAALLPVPRPQEQLRLPSSILRRFYAAPSIVHTLCSE